jgi:hypothetical protein
MVYALRIDLSRLLLKKKHGKNNFLLKKNIEVWNQASILNHIWNLFAKAGSLWVAWVNINWLKDWSVWQIPIPKACSWSLKKILKLRDIAMKFIWFKVGDGSKIFPWFDHWHPSGYLLDAFGYIVVYDSGLSLESKLSSIILHGEWFWPSARSDALVDIQVQLPEIGLGGIDTPIWDSRRGTYSCSETWDKLRVRNPEVVWWKLVWFSQAIPKHSFLLWLAYCDAIVTKHKMCGWGYIGAVNCLFCHGCMEDRDHLFFG